MKTLLILPVLLAVATQVNCGVLHRGVSSGFNPSTSSGQNSRGIGSGRERTSLGSYGLGRDGLSGARSFGSSRFSSEAGLINAGRTSGSVTGDFGFGITGSQFNSEAGVGIGLGSADGSVYSQQTQTLNIPAAQSVPVRDNRPSSIPVSIRRPVDVQRPVPVEVSSPVRVDIPRSYPLEVTRPFTDDVSQPFDINASGPVNVQSAIGSLSGIDSGRWIELGSSSGLGLARGFGRGSGINGGIETGIGSGDAAGLFGASSGSGYSDAYTSEWRPKWTYKSIGGYRY